MFRDQFRVIQMDSVLSFVAMELALKNVINEIAMSKLIAHTVIFQDFISFRHIQISSFMESVGVCKAMGMYVLFCKNSDTIFCFYPKIPFMCL